MADHDPADPRGLLENAANAVPDFRSVTPEATWTELPSNDQPAWALDPREKENDHESDSTSGRIYSNVGIEYIVYIAVESGPDPRDREDARGELDSLRNAYLDQLLGTTLPDSDYEGEMEKTGRQRQHFEQGETSIMLDAISLLVHQSQRYGIS
jgi:hypothetical protein